MKFFFSLAMASLLFLLLFSCRKEQQVRTSPVVGQWQWVQSSGGFVYSVSKPSAGKSVTLTLNKDFTFVASLNTLSRSQGTYSFTIQGGDSVIVFDKTIQVDGLFLREQQILERADDTNLALFDYSISDGYSHQFQRVK